MAELFLEVLNRSISATWLVLIIAAVRILLKKAPKWMDVVLWGLVALRLVCPFSLKSTLSLIPSAETIPPEILMSPEPQIHTGIEAINNTVNPILAENFTPEPVASANPLQILIPILALVWCAGMAGMALYTLISYWRLRHKVRTAIHISDELYLSEFVSTPFVLGLFRPRIYLPYHMPEQDSRYVIAHERTHIRRKDHWWKPFGFFLLTVNWFNPLMWLAYVLLCRDIELACDEKVIRDMDPGQRADYSQALLNCSVSRRSIAACPLAFGEAGVKERIINVLNYKKPTFWIILAAVLVCLAVAVFFLTDPGDPATPKALKWLQTLDASDILRIEYHCPSAEPGKQYALYEGDALSGAADILNSFDGSLVRTNDISHTDRIRYTLTITTTDLQVHTVENIGDVYLRIDGNYFEDTYQLLGSKWNLTFQGTDYLPSAEDSSLDVEMTVEECSPTGATVLFRQFRTGEDISLFGGNDYFLQRLTDGGWDDLPMRENPTFTEGTYSLATIRRQRIEWEWLYGVLPDGHYRIGKSVTQLDSGQSSVVYAEFTLENAPTPFSIVGTLTADSLWGYVQYPSDGGYTFDDHMTQSLVSILNRLEERDFFQSPGIIPRTVITLSGNSLEFILSSDGENVEFGFREAVGLGDTVWAVRNEALNAFFSSLNQFKDAVEPQNRLPLEDLPQNYTPEQAAADNCVVLMDGDVQANPEVWNAFVSDASRGPASVRVMTCVSHAVPENNALQFSVFDLTYNGSSYTLRWYENGQQIMRNYRYLRYFSGLAESPNAAYDAYHRYVLTDNGTATYEELWQSLLSSQSGDAIDFFEIYADLITYPQLADVPALSSVSLYLDGQALVTVTDNAKVRAIRELIVNAQQTYEPKTWSPGPELVLTGKDGTQTTAVLDMLNDLCVIDGTFFDYGPGYTEESSIRATADLLALLGLTDWPEAVYEKYPR